MADITLSAVLRVFLTEILQQLATAATAVILGISQHRLDALLVLCQALLIDFLRQLHMLAVLPPLHITDIRHLFAGDEVEDVFLGESLQRLIDLMRLHATLVGYHTLVDEAVVGKESSVVAEQGDDDTFLIGGVAAETVEIVTGDKESHTCLVVLLLCILDIAGTLQNLQGSMHTDGEVVELPAEVIDIELSRDSITVTRRYLVIIGEVIVYLADILFLGEGVADAFTELGLVSSII